MEVLIDVQGGIFGDVKAEFTHVILVSELERMIANEFVVNLNFDMAFLCCEHANYN